MNSGAHYVLPGSVRDIYREPRMAREHARFRGELLHVPNGLTTGAPPVTWLDVSVLSILGRFASKNSSFAAIGPRAQQGCGSGVHNEAGWTHRTRMIYRSYDTQGLGDADLEIGAPQRSFGE